MHHLWKEHSSECLLSLTEFVHFQYLITYHHEAICMHLDGSTESLKLDDDAELYQLSPDIPQSSIVFGMNPTNKISVYIWEKLHPHGTLEREPSRSRNRLSLFNGTQKLGINTALKSVANRISRSPKSKQGYQAQTDLSPLAVATPNRDRKSRLRHSLSGKALLFGKSKESKGPKPKKGEHQKRHSLSSNKPQLIAALEDDLNDDCHNGARRADISSNCRRTQRSRSISTSTPII